MNSSMFLVDSNDDGATTPNTFKWKRVFSETSLLKNSLAFAEDPMSRWTKAVNVWMNRVKILEMLIELFATDCRTPLRVSFFISSSFSLRTKISRADDEQSAILRTSSAGMSSFMLGFTFSILPIDKFSDLSVGIMRPRYLTYRHVDIILSMEMVAFVHLFRNSSPSSSTPITSALMFMFL